MKKQFLKLGIFWLIFLLTPIVFLQNDFFDIDFGFYLIYSVVIFPILSVIYFFTEKQKTKSVGIALFIGYLAILTYIYIYIYLKSNFYWF